MRAKVRLMAATALGLGAVLGLSGCLPVACTTIGYLNSLTVRVSGDADAVAAIEVCGPEHCERGEAGSEAQVDSSSWRFDGLLSTDETVTVRAFAADGTEVATLEATPAWQRVGGSERCGGPHGAEVELTL